MAGRTEAHEFDQFSVDSDASDGTLCRTLSHLLEITFAVAPVIRALAEGNLQENDSNAIRAWWKVVHASLGLPAMLDADTVRLIDKRLQGQTSRLRALSEKLLSNRIDIAILDSVLAYHLRPSGGPVEMLMDHIYRSYGLPPSLNANPETLSILTGYATSMIAARLEPDAPLRMANIVQIESDMELKLHRSLVRWVFGGMPGEPRWIKSPPRNIIFLPGMAADYLHDPFGIHLLLRGQASLALHIKPGDVPREMTKAILQKIASEAGKPLFYADPHNSGIALRLASRRAGLLAIIDEAEEPDTFLPFREDQQQRTHQAPVDGGMSLLWVGAKPPAGILSILDGTLALRCSAEQAGQILSDFAASEDFAIAPARCRELAGDAALLDLNDYRRSVELAARRSDIHPDRALQLHLTAIAQARGRTAKPVRLEARDSFDPRLVVCLDADLAHIEAVVRQPVIGAEAKFLIVGPPGSGKSEWARHCARISGREVQIRRAGDFLNKYVGEFERRISEWFGELAATGAVGIIDEADSLMWPRDRADASHEVTHTNEFLQLLEHHRGLIFLTSNAAFSNDRIDEAMLRRLVKLRFGYLDYDRIDYCFQNFFGCSAPEEIKLIRNLTPGDFAAVQTRALILGGNDDPEALAATLRQEARVKRVT